MKYSILMFTLLCYSNLSAEINYGMKLGYTSANQDFQYSIPGFDIDVDSDYRPGLNTGLFIEIPLIDHLQLVSDLYYTQKGMQLNLDATFHTNFPPGYYTQTITHNNRLDYIGFSTSAKLNFKLSAFMPYLLTGFRYDWMIGKETHEAFDLVYSNYNDNLYGFVFGLGSELVDVLPLTILLEGVYHYDLHKVEINENLKILNHVFEIKLGIKF